LLSNVERRFDQAMPAFHRHFPKGRRPFAKLACVAVLRGITIGHEFAS
jgi:hypothetical protein